MPPSGSPIVVEKIVKTVIPELLCYEDYKLMLTSAMLYPSNTRMGDQSMFERESCSYKWCTISVW